MLLGRLPSHSESLSSFAEVDSPVPLSARSAEARAELLSFGLSTQILNAVVPWVVREGECSADADA